MVKKNIAYMSQVFLVQCHWHMARCLFTYHVDYMLDMDDIESPI